ncbi:bone morphogenetic protein 7 [Trichonephila clavata]|uniref:Bone morphogenetic protein 7 n=1 Tax=Trichonephila clavata TaxID=2740835 RepID=A0A8X6KZT7_TRICU|nr:bone morphogenetic protein 7 [Trichonephila clavata]
MRLMQTMYFLLTCLLCGLSVFLCKGHPVEVDLQSGNHTAEALQRLLKVFGLENHLPHPRHHPLPPQYMLDLYRWLADGTSGESLHLHHHGANTVRSFYSKESSTDSNHYVFDISSGIPAHEEIVEAQFHFFTHLFHTSRSHQGSHVIQINLYDEFLNTSSKLLEARMVSAHASGWEVFRVTSSAKRWISNHDFNKGLIVQVLDGSGRVWRDRRVHRLQSSRPPILIVFSQDSKTSTTHRKPSKPHNFQNIEFQSRAANQNSLKKNTSTEGSQRSPRSAITANGDCMRHELRVDFEKLGWSTWIISPKWYDAYVCAGACAFPLGQNQRPTNHATVQSIVHELSLTAGVGAPCCVPTELHSVSLLYFDEHMNVVLKQYDDMVAAGCGCQ